VSTSPEAAAVEQPPKYSAEDLKDPAKRTDILTEYTTDLGTKPSWEVDSLMEKAVHEGVLTRASGDEAHADDIFDGLEVKPGVSDEPELRKFLVELKNQKEAALYKEKEDEVLQEVAAQPDKAAQIVRIGQLIQKSVRQEEIDVTKPVERRAGRKERTDSRTGKVIPGTPDTPAKDAVLESHNRRQDVILRVFEAVKNWEDPNTNQPHFGNIELMLLRDEINKVGQRKDDILKDERTRTERAKLHDKQSSELRAKQARDRIEAVKAGAAQDSELGLNRVTLPKGSYVENPTQETIAAGVVAKTGRLKMDIEAVDGGVHQAALADDAQFEQDHKLGTGDLAVERAHAQALAEVKQREQDAGLRAIDALSPADREIHDRHERERAEKSPAEIQEMRNTAHDEAIEEAKAGRDSHVAGVEAVRERYQKIIDTTPDANMKLALGKERDAAMLAEQQRWEATTKETAAKVSEFLTNATEHKPDHKRIDFKDTLLDEKAMALRTSLGLVETPFLEEKHGGLLHWRRKNRGPKTVESYFRVPGNENVMVLERRNRRSGELISQTIISTEKPIRKRGRGEVPPSEVRAIRNGIREEDRTAQIAGKGKVSSWLGGSLNPADFVNVGLGSGKKIDGGIDNQGGVYAEKYGADARKMSQFKYNSKRRGGFLYWVSNGRW
jgi:hypothetical protein